MGEIVGFVSKSELERICLIREARAIYDSIFPPTDAVCARPDDRASKPTSAAGNAARRRSPVPPGWITTGDLP
ncbi:hypothetical protein [Bradyrhizobium tropiciagri]|uniref:hypothetical protein n=1 Tax=Bradyrhizobium tropiciagri TaxID=312253 RepID=UPI001009AC03|nr:hypothetical protein [Bradyrhizobium tropiciagri]